MTLDAAFISRRLLWLPRYVMIAFSAGLFAADPATPDALFNALRDGDTAAWTHLLANRSAQPPAAAARDSAGNTPLHLAALQHNVAAVRALLAADAEVDARNQAGATPLLYGAAHPGIVRLLLDRGAAVNAASALRNTPLMVAAAYPQSYDVMRILLEAGAELHARKTTEIQVVLPRVVSAGDRRALDLVLERGDAWSELTLAAALGLAAFHGDRNSVERLMARGADQNRYPDFGGHALNSALLGEQLDIAHYLVEHGADPHLRSVRGPSTPPIVFAAYNQSGDTRVAKALLARGADLRAADAYGASALTYALRSGSATPLVEFLQEAGLPRNAPAREKRIPDRAVPSAAAERAALIRERLPATLALLQRSSDAFLANGFVQEARCTSCHGQDVPAVAYGLARERGFVIDDVSQGRQFAAQVSRWTERSELARQMTSPLPGEPASIAYGLLGLHAAGYPVDDMTDAMTRYLLRTQQPDGAWRDPIRRPPMEDGPIVGTALTVLGVRRFPPRGLAVETQAAYARAARWLAVAKPALPNEAVFRLLGLRAAGADRADLETAAAALVASQRNDGGWAQLPGLESDAWATGSTLYALHESGVVAPTDRAYQRGVAFLLRTQFDDGSWWVRSRTWPFQPHFDGKFPHGKDQWISQGATAWAAVALLLALEPEAPRRPQPTVKQLVAAYQHHAASPPTTVAVEAPAKPASELHFARDILPLFERSCAGCHGGEKPRAGFVVQTRAALLKGGASGEPAIVPGRADASPLLHYVSGKIEDLEMPPLDRREKYPALTAAELELVRRWVEAGALEAPAGN